MMFYLRVHAMPPSSVWNHSPMVQSRIQQSYHRPYVRLRSGDPYLRPLPAPQPIKQRYPRVLPKENPMTIAIGMLYDKGVLICVDSLVTTGTLGTHQSKILP